VVDTRYILQHLDHTPGGGINEVVQQLAFADTIVLNKMDLVGSCCCAPARASILLPPSLLPLARIAAWVMTWASCRDRRRAMHPGGRAARLTRCVGCGCCR
jgi:hypothetical protein